MYSGHGGIAEEQRLVGNNYIANIMTGLTTSKVVSPNNRNNFESPTGTKELYGSKTCDLHF